MSEPSAAYRDDTSVWVCDYSAQIEGDEAVIVGSGARDTLVLPTEALEILDDLRAGATVGEAAARYRRRHDDDADMAGLLSALEASGFVGPRHAGAAGAPARLSAGTEGGWTVPWPSQAVARQLVSTPVLAVGGILVAAAAAAAILDPGCIPAWSDLYFPELLSTHAPLLLGFYFLAVAAHEAAHIAAARAAGVSTRLGLGHRLWLLVAETDMSAAWSLPRRRRYLPFLAGPLLDLICAATVLLVLAAQRRGLVGVSDGTLAFLRGAFLLYVFGLLWQCYFFVRTDFYYVLATLLGCRNLMGDTQAYLLELVRRPWRRAPAVLPALPPAERRAIRAYAWVWLGGRALALYVLFGVQLPIMWRYFRAFSEPGTLRALGVGGSVFMAASLGLMATGLVLWLRGLRRAWR